MFFVLVQVDDRCSCWILALCFIYGCFCKWFFIHICNNYIYFFHNFLMPSLETCKRDEKKTLVRMQYLLLLFSLLPWLYICMWFNSITWNVRYSFTSLQSQFYSSLLFQLFLACKKKPFILFSCGKNQYVKWCWVNKVFY